MALPEIHEAEGFQALVGRLNQLRFKSVRIGNKNATLLLIRVAFEGKKSFVLRAEVRDVDRLIRKAPRDANAFYDTVHSGLSDLPEWQAVQKWLSGHSPHGASDLFEALLNASRGLADVMESVKKFVDEGHTDRAHAAHRIALSLKEAKKALGRAFNVGATREDIERLMDELVVEEVMES